MSGLVKFSGEEIIARAEIMRVAAEKRVKLAQDKLNSALAERRWWQDSISFYGVRVRVDLARDRRDALEEWVTMAKASPSQEFLLPKDDAIWFTPPAKAEATQ